MLSEKIKTIEKELFEEIQNNDKTISELRAKNMELKALAKINLSLKYKAGYSPAILLFYK